MKSKIFFLIFLLFAVLSQRLAAQSPFLTQTGDKVEVNINRHATDADLTDLKKELMENHQIQVDFTSLAFNKKGRLNGIGMSVKTPNGNSGTCKTTLVTGKQGVYFTVDNTPGATMPFLIGAGKRKQS
jgi:hypothetical protein